MMVLHSVLLVSERPTRSRCMQLRSVVEKEGFKIQSSCDATDTLCTVNRG